MNETGRVERVVGRCAAKPLMSELAQPLIDEGDEAIASSLVPAAPAPEQTSDLG
jgi:hypothetical protein